MHTHVQILYKISLTAYLSIELSCSFPLSWFLSKAFLLYLHHQLFTLCSPTKDLSKWVSTRHSTLRVPAPSGLYSRYAIDWMYRSVTMSRTCRVTGMTQAVKTCGATRAVMIHVVANYCTETTTYPQAISDHTHHKEYPSTLNSNHIISHLPECNDRHWCQPTAPW